MIYHSNRYHPLARNRCPRITRDHLVGFVVASIWFLMFIGAGFVPWRVLSSWSLDTLNDFYLFARWMVGL